jgi:hypothetical protein
MNNPELDVWVRTCDECGAHQIDKQPVGEMTDAYRNRKCRRCKSEALDYGTTGFVLVNGRWEHPTAVDYTDGE